MKELPEVDAFIGTNEIGRILEAADENINFKELPLLQIGNKTATYLYDFDTPRYRATDSYTAFIKIAEGCDRPCAFCSIPGMRGSFRSRRFGSILKEAEDLAKQGVKEIVLDRAGFIAFRRRFGRSGRACKTDSRTRRDKRFGMDSRDVCISDAYFRRISRGDRRNAKAVKYLDMPLQHGSRNVLKLMKRGGTRESLEKLIQTSPRKSSRNHNSHDIYHGFSRRNRRRF